MYICLDRANNVQARMVMNIRLLLSLFSVYLATLSANTNAALVDNGSGLIFDEDLGITWLADANLAATEDFGLGAAIDSSGGMTWDTAVLWIAAMNAVVNPDGSVGYLGFTGWRLPTADTSCSGEKCTNSEMGHLFWIEGVTGPVVDGVTNEANRNLFTNIQSDYYWTGTDYEPPPDNLAWRFSFQDGDQDANDKSDTLYGRIHAWAVHDGDIHVIPVPATVWLFASGLIGLVGLARRKS